MDRGSIEISKFKPTLAPGAGVTSGDGGRRIEPSPAKLPSPEDAPSPMASVCLLAGDGCVPSSGHALSAIEATWSADHPNFAGGADSSVAFSPAYRSRDGLSRRRLAASATAAFICLVLHALVLTSILWTGGSPDTHKHDAGALNAVAPEAAEDGALQVILIEDPSSPPTAQSSPSSMVAMAGALEPVPTDALAEQAIPVSDLSTNPASSVATPAPDAAVRSAMYGRYVGQIDARIERAWRRPRSAIGAPVFSCVVRVDQDSRGTVLEVTLEQCNGDEHWQQSLVSAIDSASPLPAPPDPTVFTRILHLSFRTEAYSPGAAQDAYEPVAPAQQLARTGAEDENGRALDDFARALREPSSHKVISLTLGGSPTGRALPARLSSALPPSPSSPPLPTRPPGE